MALVSPYTDCREKVRELHERDGLPFLEVFVNTPAEECVRRDPKGLYARARSGNLSEMTGVDAPYEAPRAPEVELTPGDGCRRGDGGGAGSPRRAPAELHLRHPRAHRRARKKAG